MPDFFVAEDTTSYTPYYIKAVNSGCIQNFAFKIADNYRSLLKNAKTDEQVLHIIPADSRLISAFAEYAEQKGLPAQWYYINMSRDMLLTKIRAFILRYVLTDNDFYKVYNSDDKTVIKAQQVLSSGVLPKEPQLH
jgi:hypothetical protein